MYCSKCFEHRDPYGPCPGCGTPERPLLRGGQGHDVEEIRRDAALLLIAAILTFLAVGLGLGLGVANLPA